MMYQVATFTRRSKGRTIGLSRSPRIETIGRQARDGQIELFYGSFALTVHRCH